MRQNWGGQLSFPSFSPPRETSGRREGWPAPALWRLDSEEFWLCEVSPGNFGALAGWPHDFDGIRRLQCHATRREPQKWSLARMRSGACQTDRNWHTDGSKHLKLARAQRLYRASHLDRQARNLPYSDSQILRFDSAAYYTLRPRQCKGLHSDSAAYCTYTRSRT